MILEQITEPKQIQALTVSELKILAKEVRSRIVEVVSKTGGHLAPSLGTVDLTIALLHLFDPLKDRIVWDVGHQAYSWKILTGRNAQFDTLRQYKGLSGFTNREESPYDAFTTGHSSTSISAALGIACARDLNNEQGHCIAVIGDGALTGGMSFEALNHGGHLQKDKFIVILNDNEMSISKNVGGLQKYMARMLASKSYNVLKKQVWDFSYTLPANIRRSFIYGAQKLEESMMNILVPNIIFEDLGYKYVGPIDGHDIEHLLKIIKRVKNFMVGPVLIHIVTQKGKGYPPAEKNSELFHGTGPFDLKTGKQISNGKQTWSELMGSTLITLAQKDPKIIAITAAMTAGTGLTKFEETYPDRFFDVGIAEQHSVTLAAGMSTKGLKPFVAIYSTFLQRALDQIIHDVALPKLPVVFCIDRAGLVGEDGATHHGAFDLSYLNFVPNMIILTPSTAEELSAMLFWAASYQEGPVAIRYPRGTAIHSSVHKSFTNFNPFPAIIHSNKGKIALVACGDAFFTAEAVHNLLAKDKIPAQLIQLLSVKPLDKNTLLSLASTCNYIFTFENNAVIGGMGARIAQLLATEPVKIINFGYPDHFIAQGKNSELLDEIGFTPNKLHKQIVQTLNE